MRSLTTCTRIVAVLLAAAASASADEASPGGAIEWRRDAEAAFAEARSEGRPTLLYFRCGACRCDLTARLDGGALSDPQVVAHSRRFARILIECPPGSPVPASDDRGARVWMERFGVTGHPVLIVLGLEGEEATRMGLMPTERLREVLALDTVELARLAAGPARPELPAGRAVRAYVTSFGGDGIAVVDPYAGALVGYVRTGRKPHGVAIAPDGRAVYVSNEGDGTVSVIDPETNTVAATMEVGNSPNQLEVSADGRHDSATRRSA